MTLRVLRCSAWSCANFDTTAADAFPDAVAERRPTTPRTAAPGFSRSRIDTACYASRSRVLNLSMGLSNKCGVTLNLRRMDRPHRNEYFPKQTWVARSHGGLSRMPQEGRTPCRYQCTLHVGNDALACARQRPRSVASCTPTISRSWPSRCRTSSKSWLLNSSRSTVRRESLPSEPSIRCLASGAAVVINLRQSAEHPTGMGSSPWPAPNFQPSDRRPNCR